MTAGLIVRFLYSALTLYMVLILIRWLGPALELEVEYGRWRWVSRLTDPLINPIRRILPPMGPIDFGPIAALILVWIVRIVLTRS